MRYDVDLVKRYCVQVMCVAGSSEEEAELFAQSLIFADLRGIGSHGTSRLSIYAKRVASGAVSSHVTPEICQDRGAAISIDGKNGLGACTARFAVDRCIERARQFGCCCAAVKNGTHFGSAAFYTRYAAEKGMICCIVSNAEAAVVPTGGAVPMLGTSPLSAAVPARRHEPYVLDMATSVVARGKVVLAQKEGRSIPEDWGVDKRGVPTSDPEEILRGGAMLPFGGAKGYAISLLIDLLCSALGGAYNCRETPSFWTDLERPQNIGYFIWVLDPSKFMETDRFLGRVDGILDELKGCPPAPGVREVMIPGEIEAGRERQGLEMGIELSDAVVADMVEAGARYGVTADLQEGGSL